MVALCGRGIASFVRGLIDDDKNGEQSVRYSRLEVGVHTAAVLVGSIASELCAPVHGRLPPRLGVAAGA